MKNYTKSALSDALKELVKTKPLDKVTVKDIATKAGVKRQTFYYHFHDVPELIEWTCVNDINDYANSNNNPFVSDDWRETYRVVFEVLLTNKSFITCLRHSVSRGNIEEYVYRMLYPVIDDIVRKRGLPSTVSEKDKHFLVKFYLHALVGAILDWIDDDMKDDIEGIIAKSEALLTGSLNDFIEIVK